jgi:hypothetical protein
MASPRKPPGYNRMMMQNRLEIEILTQRESACPRGKLLEVSLDLEGMSLKQLKEVLTRRFYDVNLMQAVSCIFDGITYTPVQDVGRDPAQNIRHWIELIRAIGTPSVNGVAMLGGIRQLSDAFVIKVAVPTELPALLHASIIHEYFIPTVGTNQLRAFNLGYSYVFGTFGCSTPGFDKKDVKTFCANPDTNQQYLVYERIDGDSWQQGCRTWTQADFIQNWLQLLNTLKVGELIKFNHNDLHYNNVLLRRLDSQISVPINIGGLTAYINTQIIPTMIDFGFSRIVHDNKVFGLYGFEYYGLDPLKYRPMYDVYRLLAVTLMELDRNNPALFDFAARFMEYFFRGYTITPGLIQSNPYIRYDDNSTIDQYVAWLLPRIPELMTVVTTTPFAPVLDCTKFSCQPSLDSALNTLGIKLDGQIISPRDLYDLVGQMAVAVSDPGLTAQIQQELITNGAVYIKQAGDMIKMVTDDQKKITDLAIKTQPPTPANLASLAEISDYLIRVRENLKILSKITSIINNPAFTQGVIDATTLDTLQRGYIMPIIKSTKSQQALVETEATTNKVVKDRLGEYLLTFNSLA